GAIEVPWGMLMAEARLRSFGVLAMRRGEKHMGESRNLSAMLNRHFAVLGSAAAAVAGVGIAQQADAAIIYVANANINLPSTTDGVYLNVVTGVNGTAAGTPGWDVNPWSSTGLGLFNPAAPTGGVYVG